MEQTKKSIIIMVPYPAQGHVSPMKKLASVFVSHGFEAVIVLPQHVHRKIRHNDGDDDDEKDDEIKWIGLADGQEEETAPDFFAIESVMENCMPKQLEELLEREREREKDNVVCCLVVDLLASWAIQVADKFGIPSAGFWPAMLASYLLIAAIPDMLRSGLISDTGSFLSSFSNTL